MTIPSRRLANNTAANSTTALATGTNGVEAGDLVVVMTGGGDSAPTVSLAATSGGTTVSFEGSTSTVSFGDGTSSTIAYDKRKDDSGGSGGYLHIWSARVESISGFKDLTATVSNWSTGTRRISIVVMNPGSGNTWPARATRVVRTSTTTDTAAASVDPWTIAWTGSHYNAESAAVLVVYHANAKTIAVDWDHDGDYTADFNAAADTGDGGTGPLGSDKRVYLGGTGSGSNQGVCFADSYWDTGGIPGGSDTVIGIDGSSSTGAKGGAAVLYKISAPTTVTGTASFTGGGTFTATGTRTSVGNTATFTGGGTFALSGTPTVIATMHFAGGGDFQLIQQGVTVIDGTASFSGGGTFSITGTRTVLGTATFTGGGTWTLIGAGGAQPYGSGNSWSSSSAELVGGETKTGTASFAGGGTFAATGRRIVQFTGIAHFSGGGTFSAVGTPTVVATMSFSGGGTFNASSGRDCDWTFSLTQPHWHTKLHQKWHTTLARP